MMKSADSALCCNTPITPTGRGDDTGSSLDSTGPQDAAAHDQIVQKLKAIAEMENR